MLTISEGFQTVNIYGDNKKIYFWVTLVKKNTIPESRCDRENASQVRMVIFFAICEDY
jgi:hypothetical protein